jgi:hypothetical protein
MWKCFCRFVWVYCCRHQFPVRDISSTVNQRYEFHKSRGQYYTFLWSSSLWFYSLLPLHSCHGTWIHFTPTCGFDLTTAQRATGSNTVAGGHTVTVTAPSPAPASESSTTTMSSFLPSVRRSLSCLQIRVTLLGTTFGGNCFASFLLKKFG